VPDEERERLAEFVQDCYELLGQVVTEHGEWLPAELRDTYRRAWQEIEPDVRDLRAALRDGASSVPGFYLSEGGWDERLRRAGLSGASLDLKLGGFTRARDRFLVNPIRRFLRSPLRWANIVLGSLAGVIGAAEVLKELKETVEAGVEDVERPES
jgi:hypothetical protein